MFEFAAAVFDANGLRRIFKRSPVFRIDGDEFSAIPEGSDYENRNDLETTFHQTVGRNKEQWLVAVSAGVADFNPESGTTFHEVFQRLDLLMYEHKRFLKGGGKIR